MSLLQPLCLLSIFVLGVTAEFGDLKWKPTLINADHPIDFGTVLGSMMGYGFSKVTRNLTDQNVDQSVHFYYYSRDNLHKRLVVDPNLGGQPLLKKNIEKPFRIIIHGYIDSPDSKLSSMTSNLRKKLLKFHDVNVIEVDWSAISIHPYYFEVSPKTEIVGRYVAKFLDFLIDEGASCDDFHLMGHSLGAHVAGFAGANIKKGQVGRITGLDPALPGFENAGPENRLDLSDAKFVDCIHTCGGGLGFMTPICTADFYPNGGRNAQPDCLIADTVGICSHLRAPMYFEESIDPLKIYNAYTCPNTPKYQPVICSVSKEIMGYFTNRRAKGIYYLKTKYQPF